MTPTQPSQAVEAAAKLIYETWKYVPGYVPWQDGGNSLQQDVARSVVGQILDDLRAELARPLEVAAPVGDDAFDDVRVVEKATCFSVTSGNIVLGNFAGPQAKLHAAMFSGSLKAASRAPEVVRAEPVAQISVDACFWVDVSQDEYDRATGSKRVLYTAPPSTAPAQPKDHAPCPVAVGEVPDRHIHENAARLLIDYFLCEKLDVKDAPSVTLEKQGESESESHSWAFWVLSNDTTSYLHEDGHIEWYGTAWEPEIDVSATPHGGAGGDVGAAGDWGLDTSTGTPILVYKKCSVIESEQARYVLRLIAAEQRDAKGPDSFHSDSGECDRVQGPGPTDADTPLIPFRLLDTELPELVDFSSSYGGQWSSDWCVTLTDGGRPSEEKLTVSQSKKEAINTGDFSRYRLWEQEGGRHSVIAWAYKKDVEKAISAALASKATAAGEGK